MAPARFGGLESSVLNLAEALLAADCPVTLLLSLSPTEESPVERAASARGVECVRIDGSARGYLSEYTAIRQEIRRRGIELLHSHGYRADLVHGLAARHEGIRWASTFHGFTGGGRRNRLYEWLQTHAARSAHASIAVSGAIAARLRREGIAADRCHLLHNAYPERTVFLSREQARAELGLPAEGVFVGWVGRLSYEKGPDTFVEACARTSSVEWRGVMVGDGPMRGQLGQMNLALQEARQVLFTGFQSNAARFLKAFDVIALSSRTEGTPITILEAMAAGVPIVAFPVGGVPEMLDADEAVLVGDASPAGLGRAIDSVLSEPQRAAELTRSASRRLTADFSASRWAARHIAIYRAIMRGGPANG